MVDNNGFSRFVPFKLFKGCFIPNCILENRDLTPNEKLLWGKLAQMSGRKGYCYPYQKTLSEKLGVSLDTIERSIKGLKEKNFIGTERERKKGALNTPNKYFFLWNPCFESEEVLNPENQGSLGLNPESQGSGGGESQGSSYTSYKRKEKKRKEGGQKDLTPSSLPERKYSAKHLSFARRILFIQKQKYPNFIKDKDFATRLEKSALVLEQLERLDGFDFENEIQPVIEWGVQDSFWSDQILSLGSMRDLGRNNEKKFVNIYSQYNKARKQLADQMKEKSYSAFNPDLNREKEFSI